MKKRIKVIGGGTSAGKTFGIVPVIIDKCCKEEGLHCSIVSVSMPHLKKGAMKDFLNIMRTTNRFVESRWNKTNSTYTFHNNSVIEFFSCDQEGRVRGPRRDLLYMNEATNIKFDTYHQLAIRTRGDIYIDFNPSHEFFVHRELADHPDAEHLTVTYKDNESLSKSIVDEIELAREKGKTSVYWQRWWDCYGLGQLGMLEGVVFESYSKIDKIPPEAVLVGGGLDFGFTNDPTTVSAIYKWNKKYIFDEIVFEKGLLNSSIAKKIKASGLFEDVIIYADCAEPKSIKELRLHGINVKPCKKGKDSINYGVDLMQQNEFYVTSNSTNLIDEFNKYSWAKDKDGKTLNVPVDDYNHGIDGIRYYIQTVNKQKIKFKVN
ncbi:MAG: hypothetical protein HRS51_02890 [Candidatus Nitrosopelagicus sp.]|nr:hypothetical protein [Candidatus Nitrosopelagicus sp.]